VRQVASDERWDVPLRLLGALHYLALAGLAPDLAEAYERGADAWPAFRVALAAERDFVAEFMRTRPVQTNEVGRCYGLLPAFLTLARDHDLRLDLIELGPSAGLNLLWDRYRYRYRAEEWGPADSPLGLEAELRAPLPDGLLAVQPEVGERVGIDLNPLDVTSEDTALLLQCFVWPDQRERLTRLRAALEVARRDPPRLVRGDYVELLPELLAERDPGALTVVYETASLIYLPLEVREKVVDAIAAAGAEGPVAFLSTTQPETWSLVLRTWPGGRTQLLAEVDPHGKWLEWLAR